MNVTLIHDLSKTDGRFGERLFLLRTGLGYSRKELSELCAGRITERTITRWESGKDADPRLGANFRLLADALRVSPGYLLRGEEVPNGEYPDRS